MPIIHNGKEREIWTRVGHFITITVILIVSMSCFELIRAHAITTNDTKELSFGCQKYDTIVHCDRLVSNLNSYKISANSSKVFSVMNTPNILPGKISGALEIDASRLESVSIPSSSALNNTQFSVSFWIKKDQQIQPYSYIVSHTNSPPHTGWFFDMFTKNNETQPYVRFNVVNNESKIYRSSDIPVLKDDFINIVGVFNGKLLSTYLDGRIVGKTVFNGSYNPELKMPLTIGSTPWCSLCSVWSGTIDDLRIYNRTLSEQEVNTIFTGETNMTTSSGLASFYPFDKDLRDGSASMQSGKLVSMIGGMAFAPDGRLFFTEKNSGQVRILNGSKILDSPFVKLDDYFVSWEQGLLGLTIDPKFAENHFVYVYYTAKDKSTGEIFNRVVRFTDQHDHATDMTILLDRIYAVKGFHSGGALAFGPDEKLYITVGDATEHPFAQDLSIDIGKVLRINRDGTIPSDNPFPNSPIYTLGHRNMFGIAFDKKTGTGIVTENGDVHYDEINLIQKGGNYGFPLYQIENRAPESADPTISIIPLRSYWKTIVPTQAVYYSGAKFPELNGKFLFGTFSGDIYALKVDNSSKQIDSEERISLGLVPIVSIAVSPSGEIYFGGYDIYRLDNLNEATKVSVMDTVSVSIPKAYDLIDLQVDIAKRQLDMSINRTQNTALTGNFTLVKIPTTLFVDIYKVIAIDKANTVQEGKITEDNITLPEEHELDFTIVESTADFTTIRIPLQFQSQLISIIAS